MKDQLLKIKSYLPYMLSPIISVVLFIIMGFLIFEAADMTREKTTDTIRIDFSRTYRETTSTPVERTKPKKQESSPENQQPLPPTAVAQPQMAANAAMNPNNAAPPTGRTFDATMAPGAGATGVIVGGFAVKGSAESASEGSGIYFGGGGNPGTEGGGGLTPLVRVKCEPPNNARVEGIKGNVTIRYDINEGGQTENVQVVDANPPNIFEQNCIRAVQQWRFKPKLVDGKPVAVRGSMYKFNFGDYSGAN